MLTALLVRKVRLDPLDPTALLGLKDPRALTVR